MASAAIVTIGNEIVSGDTENTNGSWLARRLAALGVEVELIAAIPDEIDGVAAFVREHAAAQDAVVVTGGPRRHARRPHARGDRRCVRRRDRSSSRTLPRRSAHASPATPEYAARWALLPEGSRPLENPLGGAPGFAIANVYVLPGLPAEMEAMFETIADELRAGAPIESWRRRYRTTESAIVAVLQAMGDRHPAVLVGSYPSFEGGARGRGGAEERGRGCAGRRGRVDRARAGAGHQVAPSNGESFPGRDAPMGRTWPWVCAGAGTCFRS